ncbi:MAG: hypothetical protein F4196_03890 [Acidimicrobiia bacterium]|nr:hypothetical protein [bacterium]MYG92024.1 hypothetical protein [Acidimicrobiia bacterium]
MNDTTPTKTIPNLEHAAVGRPVTRLGVSFFPVYLFENHLPEIATGKGSGLDIEELPKSTVPFLRATNPTRLPVLIPEGEQFLGGLQDRVLNTSVLVAASTHVDIPVSCLERGRWGNRRGFERGRAYAPRLTRLAKTRSVSASVLRNGSPRSDQAAVWLSVDEELDRVGVISRTSAVRDAQEHLKVSHPRSKSIENLVELGPLPGQCGVVVTHGRRVVAMDLFGNHSLLTSHWEGLIRSYLLEPPMSNGHPSASRVLWAISQFYRAKMVAKPGVGLGVTLYVKGPWIEGQALTLDGAVVHASSFMVQQ